MVTEENWADYVFEKDYVLMPLSKVEELIKANEHLPYIPSAEKIKDEGLSVGEMQKRMMEKIEELTLHVIEQHKRMSRLEKDLKLPK